MALFSCSVACLEVFHPLCEKAESYKAFLVCLLGVNLVVSIILTSSATQVNRRLVLYNFWLIVFLLTNLFDLSKNVLHRRLVVST